MMRYLLDTNICIYIINRSPVSVYQHFQRLEVGDVGISAITYCELQFGIANSSKPKQNQLALTKFLGPIEVLDYPSGAALSFGQIRHSLSKAGTIIGNYDLLIASHAHYEKLILVTNNTKEFERVSGLKIENWLTE